MDFYSAMATKIKKVGINDTSKAWYFSINEMKLMEKGLTLLIENSIFLDDSKRFFATELRNDLRLCIKGQL